MHFTIRQAEPADIDAIDAILQATAVEINDPNIFISDDKAHIARHISGAGFVLMAFSESEAAGFLLVDFPGEDERNLGHDLEWDAKKLQSCATMDIACVRPEYRGFGLQKRLLHRCEEILRTMGFEYALATVSPDNPPSLKSLLTAGYAIGTTMKKYGGMPRHIVWKDLGYTKS